MRRATWILGGVIAGLGLVVGVVLGPALLGGGAGPGGSAEARSGGQVVAAGPSSGVVAGAEEAGRAALALAYRGSVVSATGGGVPGAEVRLLGSGGSSFAIADAGGGFLVERQGPAVQVAVSAPGFRTLERAVAAEERDLGTLVLTPLAEALAGRVSSADGVPLAGQVVHYGELASLEGAALEDCLARVFRGTAADLKGETVVADEEGRFWIPAADVDAGLRVWARAEAEAGEVRVWDREAFVDLRLAAVRRVAGRVVDAAGRGVAGAAVTAARYGQDLTQAPSASAEWVRGTTAADGSFALPGVPRGALSLGVVAEHEGALEVFRVAGSTEQVELVLRGGSDLAGRLVDQSTGAAVAGGRVTLIVTALDGEAVTEVFATSGADGGFVLAGVPAEGVAHLVVRHAEYAPTGTRIGGSTLGGVGEVHVAELVDGVARAGAEYAAAQAAALAEPVVAQSAADFDLMREQTQQAAPVLADAGGELQVPLVRGAELTLALRDGAGGPHAGVDVRVSAMSGMVQTHGTSDVRGELRLARLTPGRYLVQLESDGLALPPGDVWVELGAANTRRELVLQRAVRVVGRLTDALGEPLAGGRVALASHAPGGLFATREWTARAGAMGGFELRGVPAGSAFTLSAEHGGTLRASVPGEVRAAEAVHELGDVVLQPVATLAGRVVAPSGLPIAGAEVHLVRPHSGAPVAAALTGPDGAFELQDVELGSVAVVASKADHYPTRLVRVDVTPGTQRRDLFLELAEGVEYQGEVLDRMHDGLEGVTVVAHWSPLFEDQAEVGPSLLNRLLVFNRAATVTHADGSFTFTGVPPDQPVEFRAHAPGRQTATASVSPFYVDADLFVRLVLGKAPQ